jgi:phospholipid/cholesterol/gamma-HCH transport system permease protein
MNTHDPAVVRGMPKGTLIQFLEWIGEIGRFSVQVMRAMLTPPFENRELVRQMDEVGTKSLPLILLAGAAIGVVISLQTRASFVRFGVKSLLPVIIVLSVVRETGPIITAFIFAGRVGAGIGAELGSMRVTEQIDAMEVAAVNVFKLLAATRVLACTLMMPLLTVVADACAIFMGWVANTLVQPVSFRLFINSGFSRLTFGDLLPATIRTAVFGFVIGIVSCFQGMRTEGGTEGVGRAATSSVVISSLLVILTDVVLVRLTVTFFG